MNCRLKEKYDEAALILKDKTDHNEVTSLIHRTPWVRILLVRDNQAKDAFSIMVEMSPPENLDSIEMDSSELINRLYEHLQYLKRLSDVGFELSVIKTGCIYCASKGLHDPLDDNLFTVLIPPQTD